MSKKQFEVIISDAALSMLDSHVDFLARVSPDAALKLMNEIIDDIDALSDNPQRFPSYENRFTPETRYRKMLTSKRYLVLFEIADRTVFVDYIVDCRQDFDWLIG